MTAAFALPPVAKVGYLDPEIAGEGQKVILSDGSQVDFNPAPPTAIMPDWSKIKAIAHYFRPRSRLQIFPAWLYHKDDAEPDRLVRTPEEAFELGVTYREASPDELYRYGARQVWDWAPDSPWRPFPAKARGFNPAMPAQGKEYVPPKFDPAREQHNLLERLTAALQGVNPRLGQPQTDPELMQEFAAFVAWRTANKQPGDTDEQFGLGALGEEAERASLEAEAIRRGVRVDKRWSIETLKAKVAEAA